MVAPSVLLHNLPRTILPLLEHHDEYKTFLLPHKIQPRPAAQIALERHFDGEGSTDVSQLNEACEYKTNCVQS